MAGVADVDSWGVTCDQLPWLSVAKICSCLYVPNESRFPRMGPVNGVEELTGRE